MTKRQLVLSSSSPWRRILLERLQIPFELTSPEVDETPLENERAESLVLRLAIMKAKASQKLFPDALIIGSDLVGTLDEHILNKPITHENAVKQLQATSGRTVRFYTGLSVLDSKTNRLESHVSTYDVTYRTLTLDIIEKYLSKEPALNCAGSLQAEGLGIALIQYFSGDDYTSLIGMPLTHLVTLLQAFDFDVL